jgi:hypothetical protein
MSIGNTANLTEAGLNGQLGNIAITLRNACQQAASFFEGVNAIGAGGLEGIGFTTGDATAFLAAANYMQTVAAVYFGTAAQTPAFNFDNALAAARGGQ